MKKTDFRMQTNPTLALHAHAFWLYQHCACEFLQSDVTIFIQLKLLLQLILHLILF